MRNRFVTYQLVNAVDAVAQALADPIRRDILRMLVRGPLPAGAIAGAFAVSRPAVSRHLRVLREAGLVRDAVHGRERRYEAVLPALEPLEQFLRELRASASDAAAAASVATTAAASASTSAASLREVDWQRRLAALETEVHRVRRAGRRQAAPVTATTAPLSNRKESA